MTDFGEPFRVVSDTDKTPYGWGDLPAVYYRGTVALMGDGDDGRRYVIVCRDDHRALTHGLKALCERIVACVNACAGMDDPAAEIAALRNRP